MLWTSELLCKRGARIDPEPSSVMRQGHFGEISPTIRCFLEHPPHSRIPALLPVVFLRALPQCPRGWLPQPLQLSPQKSPSQCGPPWLSTRPSFVGFSHPLPKPSPGGTQSGCGTTGRIQILLLGPRCLVRPGRCAPWDYELFGPYLHSQHQHIVGAEETSME